MTSDGSHRGLGTFFRLAQARNTLTLIEHSLIETRDDTFDLPSSLLSYLGELSAWEAVVVTCGQLPKVEGYSLISANHESLRG